MSNSKNENIRAGIPQCAAEMYAAQRFNASHGVERATVYGAVTTGNVWRFLRLTDAVVDLDQSESYLPDVERIVGILRHMLSPPPPFAV